MPKYNFSRNGNFIIIDVGTHSGTEIESFSNSKFFFWKLFKFFIKSIMKGEFLNSSYIKALIANHFKLKSLIKKITLILIEPNHLHFQERPYRICSLILPVAITSNKENNNKISRLYITNDDPKSQGNTIFSSRNNIKINKYTNVLNISNLELNQILEKNYLNKNSKVILRINCEGMEDEIIYSLYSLLQEKLVGILGSLKDIKWSKGEDEYVKLINFIDEKKLKLLPFDYDIKTWLKAHSFISSSFEY